MVTATAATLAGLAHFPTLYHQHAAKLVAARFKDVVGANVPFTARGLAAIHGHLYSGISKEAGKFCSEIALQKMEEALAPIQNLRDKPREEIAGRLARFIARAERDYPFGHGSAQSIFAMASNAARTAGVRLEWSSSTTQDVERALGETLESREQRLARTILRIMRTREQAQVVSPSEKARDRGEATHNAERRIYDMPGIMTARDITHAYERKGRLVGRMEGPIMEISRHHVVQAIGDRGDYVVHDRANLAVQAKLGENCAVDYARGRGEVVPIQKRSPQKATMR